MAEPNLIPDFGYNHLDAGHPDNPKPYRICGALTRNEATISPVCLHPAGKRTDHAGVGRCWLHGGRLGAGPQSARWKGGRYAHIWRGRLAQHFKAIQEDAEDPLDLIPELEARRVLLAMAIEKLNELEDDAPGSGNEKEKAGTTNRALPSTPTNTNIIGYPQHIPGSGNFSQSPKQIDPEVLQERIKLVSDLADGVVATVTQIIVSRNQTALTIAEVKYLQMKILEGIERFIPDVETRAAFVQWLIAELPGGDETGGAEAGAGSIEIQTAGEAS